MTDDRFDRLREPADPEWVGTPTDSWSSVVPGQRPPGGNADRDEADGWFRESAPPARGTAAYRAAARDRQDAAPGYRSDAGRAPVSRTPRSGAPASSPAPPPPPPPQPPPPGAGAWPPPPGRADAATRAAGRARSGRARYLDQTAPPEEPDDRRPPGPPPERRPSPPPERLPGPPPERRPSPPPERRPSPPPERPNGADPPAYDPHAPYKRPTRHRGGEPANPPRVGGRASVPRPGEPPVARPRPAVTPPAEPRTPVSPAPVSPADPPAAAAPTPSLDRPERAKAPTPSSAGLSFKPLPKPKAKPVPQEPLPAPRPTPRPRSLAESGSSDPQPAGPQPTPQPTPLAPPLAPAPQPVAQPSPVVRAPRSAQPTSGPPASVWPAPPTRPEPVDRPVSAPPQRPVSPAGGAPAVPSPDTVLPVPEGTAAGAATALGAPTMLAPVVRPRHLRPSTEEDSAPPGDEAVEPIAPDEPDEPEEPEEPAEPPPPDPEQVLASYEWRFHHETLRELVENPDDLREIRDSLTTKLGTAGDDRIRARLLSLRAVVSRILGDLGKALADAKLALTHAQATGELRRIAIAQARLAHVLQWRGEYPAADRLFAMANSSELPDRLRATMHEHAGRSSYDQGRYMEACNHFEKALELRKVEDPELIARTELALDAVFRKVAGSGWGPYPRTPDEILQIHRPPGPMFDQRVQRWGYATADGKVVVAALYADAQPFREGAAWVRRPEARTWELIDETGQVLIPAEAGYLGVGSFSGGLAWVSHDGTGSWIAIDKSNKVAVATGFDDARPFRSGVAAVRQFRWGAVDTYGRVVLPMHYDGFATALTDGRYVDGFTDEGLAIVETDGRKGVVDRAGRVIVPPGYPAMVIHPVAFLIAGPTGQWGALDRRGEPLIDPVHPSRTIVMDEIDRLLADTKPVL